MLFGVAIQQHGHASEVRPGGVDLEGGVGAGNGRGRRGSEEDEAERPDRFEEEPFEGVGTQTAASDGGDDDIVRSKPQLEGQRTRLDVADLSDCVID